MFETSKPLVFVAGYVEYYHSRAPLRHLDDRPGGSVHHGQNHRGNGRNHPCGQWYLTGLPNGQEGGLGWV